MPLLHLPPSAATPNQGQVLRVALLLILFVLAATAAHLLLQAHPTWTSVPLALLDDIFILGVGLGLLTLLAALGHRMLLLTGIFARAATTPTPSPTSLERALSSLIVGWALASLVLLVVGLAGLLTPLVVVALLAGAFLVSWPSLRHGFTLARAWLARSTPPRARATATSSAPARSGMPERILLAILASLTLLLMGLALLYALAPPTADDALIYHLAGPQAFLRAGRIAPLPQVRLANFPMATEMLYLVALALQSPSSAQVIHWGFAVLTGLALIACGRWLYPQQPATALLAAMFFALTPMVALLAGWAFIDLALTFAVTMTVYAALRWIEAVAAPPLRPSMPFWAITAGLAGGLALTAKYTAIFPVGLAFGAMILSLLAGRRIARLRHARSLLVAVVLLLIVAGPWYTRNWRWFGNPLYPVSVTAVLQSAAVTAPVSPATHPTPVPVVPTPLSQGPPHALPPAPSFHLGVGHTLGDYLRLPWDVVTHQALFSTTPPVPLSPFFILAPLGLWGARSRRWPAAFGGLALAGFAFWAIGYPDMRYYLPYVPLWCLLAAGGTTTLLAALSGTATSLPREDHQQRRPSSPRRLARSALLAVLVTTALGLGVIDWASVVLHDGDGFDPIPSSLAVSIGTATRQTYLIHHLASEQAILYLNNHAPHSATVLFLWNDRIFWSQLQAIPDQSDGTFARLLNADQQARQSHQPFTLPHGATYLLVSHETAVYDRANGWAVSPGTIADYAAVDAVAHRWLTLLYADPAFSLYGIPTTTSPHASARSSLPSNP